MSLGFIAVASTADVLSFTRRPRFSLPPHHHLDRSPLLNRLTLTLTPRSTLAAKNRFPLYKECFPSPWRPRAVLGDGGGLEWQQDAGATALVVAGAYALVSAFDSLTGRNLIQQISTSTGARYFASIVPFVNCLRLLIYGLSLAKDEGLVNSVTREGKPEELLRGPLYYVLMLILSAMFFWRDSPVGVIAVSMMCGGDGIADIIGRRFGSVKLPYNHRKSWAGSISMFVFGFLVSIGMLYYFSSLGYFELNWNNTIQRVAFVSLVATLVESLPITGKVDDNISVPLASMVAAYLSFGL
ncbi:OLC1v1026205C1 [Oldenlandia corymbosa var. corymbosa]|uniref:phytol kinase n=1 Tax=Oldenlandia corymbosa var. corymbosa TaxID=529605 RepID=A0AAV1C767_OLDCO|nr:OLC1v1026205C1 [Oldenlandia corymbosa var. corymbosa]